ncbi:MAG: helix-turn-helix transcriptional regulator [Bacteroidota bacterium]
MHQILKNIRSLRELRGYSQEYMAESLGITQSSYARFENEPKKIDFRLIERIADICEIPMDKLIAFHDFESRDGQAVSDTQDTYRPMNVKLLEEKVRHLEEVNTVLRTQLKDKEAIIELLRKSGSK